MSEQKYLSFNKILETEKKDKLMSKIPRIFKILCNTYIIGLTERV